MGENVNMPDVPYIVHESEMARAERYIKKIWAALLVMTVAFAAAVCGFFWYLNLYDFSSYEYTQDGHGVNIVGDENGVDYNGSASIYPQKDTKKRQN